MNRLTPDDLASRVTVFDVDSLTLWEANPNKADTAAIHSSMEEWGQIDTILVATDDQGRRVVVDGNHRVAAERSARRFGGKLAGIDVTGLDWTDVRAFAAGLALNRTARLGADDEGLLAAILTQIGAEDATLLRAMAYTDDDLASLLDTDGLDDGDNRIAGDPDDIPDDAPAVTQLGDVWLLGPHRVMAGDALDPAALDTLLAGVTIGCLLTDPPYGIDLETDYKKMGEVGVSAQVPGGSRRKTYRPVINDNQAFDASSLRRYFANVKEQFWFGGDYYRSTLSDDDLDGAYIVWDKRKEGSDNFAGSGFELIWTPAKHQRCMLRHFWFGMFGAVEARDRLHPTQKPVAMLAEILNRWAPAACAVADPFAGSGSTLIAAHQTGRTAYLMELDARYVDTICARFQKAAGIVPVLEATGKPVSFLPPADTPTSGAAASRKRRTPAPAS